MIDSKKIVEEYLHETSWKTKENSNATRSFGALGKHIQFEVMKDYWLSEVMPENIAQMHHEGWMHIHDLGGLTLYCCGYSLRDIIQRGVKGPDNIPESTAAKHFGAILAQAVNLAGIFQNEIMGAVAFSSFDTLLAPFIVKDKLSYVEVKQIMQNFLFSINSNSRCGAEPAFTNITLDLTPPKDLIDQPAIIGSEPQDFTYRDCQKEMDMINKIFCELILAGDAKGRPFSYPIPTYNIHERFDWENPNNEALWKMTGKYGTPYFANYIGSDMDPSDARSMCCRLRLDLRELKRRSGGLFGSGDSTGSIGVITMNLPRFGMIANDKEEFFSILNFYMCEACKALEIKRKFLQEEILDGGLLPAFSEYVGTFNNHFSTIGIIGLNECLENLLGCNITEQEGMQFAVEVMDFMNFKLSDFQEETGNLYNLEATPAEGTCYSLAKLDVDKFKGLNHYQGPMSAPYYTNSCHMPVWQVDSINQVVSHQSKLQTKFTGGTALHLYLDGPISATDAKHIIKTACENYAIPYIDLSPLNAVCPKHGFLDVTTDTCPVCGAETEKFQRVTGYPRRVSGFNIGKASEFADRKQLHVNKL